MLQEEKQNKNEQLKVRGTTKAADLKGDVSCPSMYAVSVYGTKPVHFLSMYNNAIKWIMKKRRVFNKATQKSETSNFLRLNITPRNGSR